MNNTLIIAGAIFASVYVVASLAYIMFRQYMRLRFQETKERVMLDDFRAHLEHQVMDLNAKFASTEGRWRELNHLVVAGQVENSGALEVATAVRPSEFLRSHGIQAAAIETRPDLLFVLTPFHAEFDDEYEAVAQVGRDLGFTVNRGDERVASGDIFPQLLRLLVSARIVVANISGRNPNVFYELGIAHALDKSVILLAHNETEVPFDIRSKRIVFYQSSDEIRERLSKMLARMLVARDA
jgi:hypothetical protein